MLLLEGFTKEMHRGTLVRSLRPASLRFPFIMSFIAFYISIDQNMTSTLTIIKSRW